MKNRCQKDLYQTDNKVHGCNSARWVLKSLRWFKSKIIIIIIIKIDFFFWNKYNQIKNTLTVKKRNIFKKPRQIWAVAKANPYRPHACSSSVPVSSLVTVPSNEPHSSADKDSTVGFWNPLWSRELGSTAVMMLTVGGRDVQTNSPTLRTGVSLYAHWSHSMTVYVCAYVRV